MAVSVISLSNQSISYEFNKRLTNRNVTIEIYTMVKNVQL